MYKPVVINPALNPVFTFDTFIQSSTTAFTLEMARKAASREQTSVYNPLHVYGKIGYGKTHLLSAIANQVGSENCLMINTGDLEVEYERAARLRQRAELREWLTSAKMLLVDDIQLCEGNESLQRELFSVMNHFIYNQRQTVISSDVPPTRLNNIEERLVSRFGCGVVVELQMCDRDGRLAILRQSFAPRSVPDEVYSFLADTLVFSIRSIRGSVNQIIAFCEGTGQAITLESVQRVLGFKTKPSEDNFSSSQTPDDETESYNTSNCSIYKKMLESAESEEEQALALQIALVDRLRQLKKNRAPLGITQKIASALELLRAGHIHEAMKLMSTP